MDRGVRYGGPGPLTLELNSMFVSIYALYIESGKVFVPAFLQDNGPR